MTTSMRTPYAVECGNEDCPVCGFQEAGAPGPTGWLDLQVWRGNYAHSLGFYCSTECLWEALLGIDDDDVQGAGATNRKDN